MTYKGRIVGERYGPGITRSTRLPSWSMGKSLTATLIGQLIHNKECTTCGHRPCRRMAEA